MNEQVKKNLLDLSYDTYLQRQISSVVIIFTYIMGILVAWITNQLQYAGIIKLSMLAIFSFLIFLVCIITYFKSQLHMKRIKAMIRDLEI